MRLRDVEPELLLAGILDVLGLFSCLGCFGALLALRAWTRAGTALHEATDPSDGQIWDLSRRRDRAGLVLTASIVLLVLEIGLLSGGFYNRLIAVWLG